MVEKPYDDEVFPIRYVSDVLIGHIFVWWLNIHCY